jgi:hypothetical protein
MTKHTPGPWAVGPLIAGEDIFILADNGKVSIAKATNLETYADTFEKLRPLAAECKANALLMADAPAMLEALEIAFNALRSSAGPEERASVADTLWPLIAKHMEPSQ